MRAAFGVKNCGARPRWGKKNSLIAHFVAAILRALPRQSSQGRRDQSAPRRMPGMHHTLTARGNLTDGKLGG